MPARDPRRWVLIVGAALILLLGSGVAVVYANQGAPRSGASGTPVTDADKQRLLATVEAQWEADKRHPQVTPILPLPTIAASCPREPQVGVFPFKHYPEKGSLAGLLQVTGKALISQATTVSSTGQVYALYAGATDADAEQGLLIVVPLNRDPCAVMRNTRAVVHQVQTPQREGAVMIIAIDGDAIVFTTAHGGGGRFNYETEQFLAVSPDPGVPNSSPRGTPPSR